jgi:DNA-binding transcriptional regulator YhcF (GntR family)
MQTARPIVDKAVERLLALGLSEEEIKRLIDAAIAERAPK